MTKFYILAFLMFGTTMFSQIKILGKVTDKNNIPIEFAEIVLIAKDSIALKSELTDEKGNFEIEANVGWNKIEILQAKKLLFSKIVDVNDNVNLGTIIVENAIQLQNVIINSKRKLIERKIDRTVFNVENSINSNASDAFELLRVTPGVKVQNDNITLIGKNNLGVLINDRMVQMSGADLTNYLKSIASDDIKSIEVITTPPAKYEAQGNSGLLNIIFKKGARDSWNASIGASYLQRKYGTPASNASYNYNKGKFQLATSINIKGGKTYIDKEDFAYYSNEIWNAKAPFVADELGGGLRLDAAYQATNTWKTGIQFTGTNGKKIYTDAPTMQAFDNLNNVVNRYLNSSSYTTEKPITNAINFFNEFKLDTIGKKMTFDLDFFDYKVETDEKSNGISKIDSPIAMPIEYFAGININKENIRNFSGKIDFTFPIKYAELSFGGKISKSVSKNDINQYIPTFQPNPIINLPLTNTKFDYNENVQALYLSGSKHLNEKWETQLGLRVEATQTKTFAQNTNQTTTNDYVKFFPTAYLTYTANENSTFSANYSKRINRPQYESLNPNLETVNPFQIIKGNPFLQPAFIDNYELSYTYKNLENKLYYSNEDNMFAQVPLTDPITKKVILTSENFIKNNFYGITESYTYDKYDFWNSNLNFDLNYIISRSNLLGTEKEQKGYNSTISTSNDFVLNKSKTFTLNASYWYTFAGIENIFHNAPTSSFDFGIRYLLFNKNLGLTLRGKDLFNLDVKNATTTVNGVYQQTKINSGARGVQFAIVYKFGNKKIQAEQHEAGNEEERKRT
jgi:Outer membrane protein beta-barrel family